MSATAATDAQLEEFCERATAAAAARAGRRLDYRPKDRNGFWTFHCPLDGPDHDPHQWNGEPQARAKMVGGRISAGCGKCTGGPFDDVYTARLLEAVGWSANVAEIQFGAAHSRHHHYATYDDRYEVRRTKLTFKDRRKNPLWLWAIRDRDAGAFGSFQSFKPSEFCAERYAEFKDFYLVLRLYGAERFPAAGPYRVVVCEGERDADTFNAVMTEAGATGLIATTLPVQMPKALSAHQRAIFENRDVILIGDADAGGMRFVNAWHRALAEVATSVRIFPPELLELVGGGKDFTDHVEQQENAGRTKTAIAQRLLEKISSLPIAEPPPNTDWRNQLVLTKNGGPKSDSIRNAEVLLTAHPELAGKIRRDIRRGEPEIVDAPWGGSLRGVRPIANAVSSWLEGAERFTPTARALEAALNFDSVAPAYNPFEELVGATGDSAALDEFFIKRFPLEVPRLVAVRAARVFWADFAAKLRGELIPQRVLIGIATPTLIDVAHAVAGAQGLVHTGTVRPNHLAAFARRGIVLVQVGLDAAFNRRTAPDNLASIFAPHVFNAATQQCCPTPLFIAVGAAPARADAATDKRVITLQLET